MPSRTPNAAPPPVPVLVSGVSWRRSRGIPDPRQRRCTMAADETGHERSIRTRQTIRILVWVVVVAAVAVVAAVNTQEVDVDWLVGESTLPLWVVIALATLAGAVIGWVARSATRLSDRGRQSDGLSATARSIKSTPPGTSRVASRGRPPRSPSHAVLSLPAPPPMPPASRRDGSTGEVRLFNLRPVRAPRRSGAPRRGSSWEWADD